MENCICCLGNWVNETNLNQKQNLDVLTTPTLLLCFKLQCYHVVLVGYCTACPNFSEITNRQYLWKGLSDFVDFLHLVICILLDVHWSYKNMLFWVDIISHRLSVNQIVRCFKLKKLGNYMRYQVIFLLLLKLHFVAIISYCFGLCLQNNFVQSVTRIFYFWVVSLVNLNTVGPLRHCTCLFLKY